jgi:uncharacterized membrane protein YvlD (DUF360 family)
VLIAAALVVAIIIAFVRPVPMISTLPISPSRSGSSHGLTIELASDFLNG